MFRMVGARMDHRLDAYPLLVAASKQACASGGTYRAAGMKVGEEQAFPSQTIHARCLVMGVAVRGDAWPRKSHVVHHHDYDVGLGIRRRGLRRIDDRESQHTDDLKRSFFYFCHVRNFG